MGSANIHKNPAITIIIEITAENAGRLIKNFEITDKPYFVGFRILKAEL